MSRFKEVTLCADCGASITDTPGELTYCEGGCGIEPDTYTAYICSNCGESSVLESCDCWDTCHTCHGTGINKEYEDCTECEKTGLILTIN